MTQDPPQSWPRREPGRSGTRPLAVDPLTGELIETDPPAAGEPWAPGAASEPVAGAGPTAPERPVPDQRAAPGAWAPGPPPAGGAGPTAPERPAPGAWPPGPPPAAAYPVPPAPAWPNPAYGYPGSPPPYGAPAWDGARSRPTNGMAIASLILGAVWLFWLGSVLALVFGYLARSQIRRSGEEGDGLAVAGLVLGWVGIGLLVLTIGGSALDSS